VYLVRTQSQIVRSCGRSALKVKIDQNKSNDAISTDLPGISLSFAAGMLRLSAPLDVEGFTIKPMAHNFSVVSTEKSRSNMLIYVHLCKIYTNFTFLTLVASSVRGRKSQ
jgi:hypothetical protein